MTKSTGNGPKRPGRIVEVTCTLCGGSGRRGNKSCTLCNGNGVIKVPSPS
jgi:DnaJ-class molecular chaperone